MATTPRVENYSEIEKLCDGRPVEIRALRSDDRTALLAAVSRTSEQSLYRRFFSARREFSEQEVAFFVNVNFTDHVALVAVVGDGKESAIAGGGRYVALGAGQAEVAFVVVDEYQGQGIGSALLRHLATLARNAGLRELIAEVLPENVGMLKVFERSGLSARIEREPGLVHVTLGLR